MTNLRVEGIYDMELKGKTSHNYADQVKITFTRLMSLQPPRAVELGGLFTTA